MLLNIYELPIALQEIYKEESLSIAIMEIGLDVSMITEKGYNLFGSTQIQEFIIRTNKLEVHSEFKPAVNASFFTKSYYPRSISNALESFKNKYFVIEQKTLALKNISANIQKMSDSNIEILNLAFESARNSYKLRQDLELSVLNSRLKLLEIDIMKIKTMTASEFEAKYGAV